MATRTAPLGRISVQIGSEPAGWVQSGEGGAAFADVVTETPGPDGIAHKHLGPLKYADITMATGPGMSSVFYDWVQGWIQGSGKDPGKDGAVHYCDPDGKIRSSLQWRGGVIREIAFPALDASSKDAAAMTLTVSPQSTRTVPGAGSQSIQRVKVPVWLRSNFGVSIQGCEDACKRVSKIEAFTIKQAVPATAIGDTRTSVGTAAAIEFPNLVLSVAESFSGQLLDWHRSFVIDGKNSPDMQRTGELQFLTPDLQRELFRLSFLGLGIFKLTREKVEAGSENVRRLVAEMYCERAQFTYGAAAAALS